MKRDHLFWDAEKMMAEYLPTLQELFDHADADMLSELVLDRFASFDLSLQREPPTDEERKGACDKISDTLRAMCATQITPSDEYCIMPILSFDTDAQTGDLEAHVISQCVRMADLPKAREAATSLPVFASRSSWNAWLHSGETPSRTKHPIDTYDFQFTPRNETLGYRVWMHGPFSRRERYLMLADAFYWMTNFGLDGDSHDKAVADELETMREDLEASRRNEERPIPGDIIWQRYGLEASTDDYDSEYRDSIQDLAMMLNHNMYVDLLTRMADLQDRIDAYEHGFGNAVDKTEEHKESSEEHEVPSGKHE